MVSSWPYTGVSVPKLKLVGTSISSIGSSSLLSWADSVICFGLTPLTTTVVYRDLFGRQTTPEAVPFTLGKLTRYTAINSFLTRNKLLSLIRAHEAQFEGFKAYVWQNYDFPQVITLFSAPNYCGTYANKGAIIKINNNELQVMQYNFTPKPDMLLQLGDAFTWSLPLLSKSRKLNSDGHVHRFLVLYQRRCLRAAEGEHSRYINA